MAIKKLELLDKFDKQTFYLSDVYEPDLENVYPKTFKEWGIPIPYEVLLSPAFEIKTEDVDYADVLLEGITPPTLQEQKDFRTPGSENGYESYASLYPLFAVEFEKLKTVFDQGYPVVKKHGTNFFVHPFKLALFIATYMSEMESNFEVRDRLTEFLDKLFLIATLPYIFDNLKRFLAIDDAGDIKQENAKKFLDEIKVDLFEKKDKLLSFEKFFNTDSCYLKLSATEYKEIFGKGGNFKNGNQLFLSIDDLDLLLSESVEKSYANQKEIDVNKDLLEKIDKNVSWKEEKLIFERKWKTGLYSRFFKDVFEKHVILEKIPIQTKTHQWLYKTIRPLVQDYITGLALNTLEFDHNGLLPLPTITDEVDLRPAVWAKQAFELAGEKFVFEKRTLLGKELISGSTDITEIYEIDFDFRRDWIRYGDILAEIDKLRKEVSEFGYELDLDKAADTDKTTLGVFRTQLVQYRQVITSFRTVAMHHSRSRGWFRGRRHWITWHKVPYQTTVSTVREDKIPVKVDWDPVYTYLSKGIDNNIYKVESWSTEVSQTTAAKEATTKELEILKKDLKEIRGASFQDNEIPKNKHKDYRIFSVANGEMQDQYGNPLAEVMKSAEDARMRRILLLLLPVIEKNEVGNPVVVGYKAIHNPVGSRNTYSLPKVELLEEFEQNIEESTSYFIGPLAHTETLLPGEKRFISIKTESSSTTNLTESRSESTSISTKSSTNIQNQIRQEVNNITRKSQQNSWSVSVSGSGNFGYAKVGGTASASGTRSKSSENTVNNLNDHVSKVMNEVTQNNEVTISTSYSENWSNTNSQEQKIEIENFNSGRSVTHKFHQVLRKFISSPKIIGLRVLITYNEEFVAGYGYRRAEIFDLNEINLILPEFIEVERAKLIESIKERVKERHNEIEEDDGVLNFPKSGISLDNKEWHINSGSYVISTEMADEDVLEQYVVDARTAQIARVNAEKYLIDSQAESIKNGKLVLPFKVNEFNFSITDKDEGETDE